MIAEASKRTSAANRKARRPSDHHSSVGCPGLVATLVRRQGQSSIVGNVDLFLPFIIRASSLSSSHWLAEAAVYPACPCQLADPVGDRIICPGVDQDGDGALEGGDVVRDKTVHQDVGTLLHQLRDTGGEQLERLSNFSSAP